MTIRGIRIAVRRGASFQTKHTRHFAKVMGCKYTAFFPNITKM